MTEKFEGIIPQRDKSAQAYEDIEKKKLEGEASLLGLEKARADELEVHDGLLKIYPNEPDVVLAIKEESVGKIDSQITEVQANQEEIEKKLSDLLAIAQAEANKENARRRTAEEVEIAVRANHEALKREILPTIHRECEKIHSWQKEVENISNEMVKRADDIERELDAFSKTGNLVKDSAQVTSLILEFFEIQKILAEIHMKALGWKKGDRDLG